MPTDDELSGSGWSSRLLSTGKVAAYAARIGLRQLLGRSGPTDGLIGTQLAGELDRMKGLAMKAGQILSYFEGVLPAETHEALRLLQRGVAQMSFRQVQGIVEGAFGESLAALFEEFDEEPVAAASIGQVHRARWEGLPVAVKVQYPHVREDIETDFSRVESVGRIASAATAVDGRAIIEELKDRVRQECDYIVEASAQEAFRRAFAGDDDVHIPATVASRTRINVLTTRWADGRSFYEFAGGASSAEKNAAAQVLLRFAYRSFYELGTVNADPHPGNYLVPREGPIVFLDFGCVRQFDVAFVTAERALARVVLENRRADFRDALIAAGMVSDVARFDFDFQWDMLRHHYAPYCRPRFQFTAGYVRAGMEFGRPTSPNARRLTFPPQWIWLQRLQWGLHAVLARLNAEGNFAEVFRRYLATEVHPLRFEP